MSGRTDRRTDGSGVASCGGRKGGRAVTSLDPTLPTSGWKWQDPFGESEVAVEEQSSGVEYSICPMECPEVV